MLTGVAIGVTAAPLLLGGYAYGGYPALLALIARGRKPAVLPPLDRWPTVTIVIPVHNEGDAIGATLEHVLEIDYPRDVVQVLVVSDASDDDTDDIVRSFAGRGVELLRIPVRGGKTAAENAAGVAARGSIIVNLDATIRIQRGALRALVQAFRDPSVGVVSGRDVAVGRAAAESNRGEGRYTSYEMSVRSLETRVGSLVGASGCFFGSRAPLYRLDFPEQLSRDFGSALVARVHGFRTVAAADAVCYVPCTASPSAERIRKQRTMARGMSTLWHMRALLDPIRYGWFAWMLWSHKVCRWCVTLTMPFAVIAMVVLGVAADADWIRTAARVVAVGSALVVAVGWLAGRFAESGRAPRVAALPMFLTAAIRAGLGAWIQFVGGVRTPAWTPTRRANSVIETTEAVR